MKNYIIALLLIIIIVLASFLYKQKAISIYDHFPIEKKWKQTNVDVSLYLYFFFSKQNCPPCLEVIDVLNRLKSPFKVIGVIPEEELKDPAGVKQTTGATFTLIGWGNFTRYIPKSTPTIIGVSGNGKIYLVLPTVSNNREYLIKYLYSIYTRLYPRLVPKKEYQ